MKIGVQGQIGSACDAAAVSLQEQRYPQAVLAHFNDAEGVLAALESGAVDAALIAAESPVGVPVAETSEARKRHPGIIDAAELQSEVAHCLMIRPDAADIRKVASHPIVLEKHREFLTGGMPGYIPVPVEDPGLAAKQLSEGILSSDTAVIALPRAADKFGLKVLDVPLPANRGYLTRFVLVKRAK